jgi:hypothetical protein
VKKANFKFLFDESHFYTSENIRTCLEEAIFVKDANGSPRRVVLVGQGLMGIVNTMKRLGIDLSEKSKSSGFHGVLETATLGKYSPLLLFPSTILTF